MDGRLQEFRFVVFGKVPEFVPFASDKGLTSLRAFWKSQPTQGEGLQ